MKKETRTLLLVLLVVSMLTALGVFVKEKRQSNSFLKEETGERGKKDSNTVSDKTLQSVDEKTDTYEVSISALPSLDLSAQASLGAYDVLKKMRDTSLTSFKSEVKDFSIKGDLKSSFDAGFIASCARAYCSVLFSQAVYYSGAAHPFTVTQAVVFGKASGKVLSLSDIFLINEAFHTKLTTLLTQKAKETLRDNHKDDKDYVIDEDWIKEGLKSGEERPFQFSISDDVITFYFDEYQLASRVEQLTELSLPLDSLKEFKK